MATRLGARALGNQAVDTTQIKDGAVTDPKTNQSDADTLRPKRRARVLAAQAFS